jgi:hypothetical protein
MNEQIENYIKSMEHMESIGVAALGDIVEAVDYDEYLKILGVVIKKLKKEGLQVRKTCGWIHR